MDGLKKNQGEPETCIPVLFHTHNITIYQLVWLKNFIIVAEGI